MPALRFEIATSSVDRSPLRQRVRDFLEPFVKGLPPERRALSWTAFDAELSRAMGQAGFVGMTLPRAYGGHGLSHLDRFAVIEEVLAAGAPVAAHWMADRQSGPLLARFGSEELKRTFIPKIVAGEGHFCIGMSEPDTGSDLASVSTFATKVEGGYRVTGTKLWSTHVTRCPHMIALVRTSRDVRRKHEGLSQLLIDLDSPGITIRPIRDMAGHEHFGEVFFDEAFVPEARLIGAQGQGWKQVMAELSLERSGPERYLSSFALLQELVAFAAEHLDPELTGHIGRFSATLAVLRQMSLSVATKLARGEELGAEPAIVKELGTSFEQDIPRLIRERLGVMALREGGTSLARTLGMLSLISPSFSLRGGTREILRGIIAKELRR